MTDILEATVPGYVRPNVCDAHPELSLRDVTMRPRGGSGDSYSVRNGTVAVTSVPPPEGLAISRRPPSAVTLSSIPTSP